MRRTHPGPPRADQGDPNDDVPRDRRDRPDRLERVPTPPGAGRPRAGAGAPRQPDRRARSRSVPRSSRATSSRPTTCSGGSDGCEVIVNSAALLGGAVQDLAESLRTNADGSTHAYDAAASPRHPVRHPELHPVPRPARRRLTEDAAVADDWADDPYTQSKGAAYVEAKRRVAEDGDDIVIVIPGGTYGPGLVLSRAMAGVVVQPGAARRGQRQAERLRHLPRAVGVRRGRRRGVHRRRPAAARPGAPTSPSAPRTPRARRRS